MDSPYYTSVVHRHLVDEPSSCVDLTLSYLESHTFWYRRRFLECPMSKLLLLSSQTVRLDYHDIYVFTLFCFFLLPISPYPDRSFLPKDLLRLFVVSYDLDRPWSPTSLQFFPVPIFSKVP